MPFKTMPEEETLKLLEGTKDTVTEPLNELFSKIKNTLCPSCGIALVPKPDFETPFSPDSHVPRYNGYCSECGLVMDVFTSKIHTHPMKRDVLG